MDPHTVSLEDALRLLSLPRVVGTDPDGGEEVLALNGRYGPYVKKGKETRSLETEEQLWSVSLDEALAVLAKPRRARGGGAASPPLRELGADPVSGATMLLRQGRYGPYVTDGEVNASLRRGDTIESVSAERASELLAERRARASGAKAGGRKAGGGKAGGSKTGGTKAGGAKSGGAGGNKSGGSRSGGAKDGGSRRPGGSRSTGQGSGRSKAGGAKAGRSGSGGAKAGARSRGAGGGRSGGAGSGSPKARGAPGGPGAPGK
jgi:DNA topoisomerase-1